jgi:hypothetical protein
MLQFMSEMPRNVVGIHAVGHVSSEDYEKVLIPRLDELARRQGEINYLLVLDTPVWNFSTAAWWEDFRLAIKHFRQWNKVAIVTDQKGVEWLADISRFFIPGVAKGFTLGELEEAKKWVSEEDKAKQPEPPSDNDSLQPELENSSNKGQGPAGENL